MVESSGLSKWWLGSIAGAVIVPSSLLFLWKMRTGKAESSPAIPLHGEGRARLEKFIFIEADFVGVVLGRHLRNIRKIEYETRAFINLISYGPNEMAHNTDALLAYENAASNWNNNEEEANDERAHFLRIHAQTKEQLAIDALIADAKRRKNREEIKIPAEAVGFVIGKNGDRIKKLSRLFRVRTMISREGGEYETVLLEGTPEGIEGAKTRILEMVDWSVKPSFDEVEMSVDEQIKQMVEFKEKLEESSEMW